MTILGIIASSGASITPIIPTDLADLELWLDASDTSTITLSGSAVTQWDDKSGNSYSFTQATAAYRPASGTRTQNGLNVLDFGTNDLLQCTSASSDWKFLHDGSNYTIITAFKSDLTSTAQFLSSTYGLSTATNGFANYIQSNNNYEHVVTRSVGGTFAVNNVTSFTPSTNFTYTSILSDPDNGTAADRSDIRFLRGSAIKNNASTLSANTGNPATSLRIGDATPGENIALDGMFAEIIIYKQILSASDLLAIQQYIESKWGV
jgi:hypothetical protein